jgi:PHP family Zn ribbon phosphoesterase
MSKRNTKCPKCQGEMEKGYLLGAWSWISDKNQIKPREAKKSLVMVARTVAM